MDDGQDEESKPTFRIRFTISSCGENSRCKNPQNTICSREIHNLPNSRAENKVSECNSNHQAACDSHRKRAFEFIRPHNHKSSLIVNLSDISRNSDPQHGEQNHLFVSPDLEHYIPSCQASPTDSALSSPDFFEGGTDRSVSEVESTVRSSLDSTMSHGCNFINWSSAARRRSSSVTRSNNTQTTDTDSNGRRALSSHDLTDPANPLENKSASGNHLAAGMSSETICDQTTTNRHVSNHHGPYLRYYDTDTMQPLDVQIDVPELLNHPMTVDTVTHPMCLDESPQIDMETLCLEDECRMLEGLVQSWEDKVEQLERERFKKTASRSLIDKLIQKRKHIRELDFQLFKLNLEAQDFDCLSQKLSPLSDNENHIQAGRFGSQLKPGQENTADILDAIPPSAHLQHKLYLTKASSGTDHSEYSRAPTDSRHRHFLPRRNSRQSVYGPAPSGSQVHDQIDSSKRFSPVRPDHFKGDFLSSQVIVSEDSGSPSGDDNPPCLYLKNTRYI